MPDRDIAKLVGDLVAVDSVNPDIAAGGAGEGEIARFVAGWLDRAGLDVSLDEVAPGRWNAVGVARGRGGGRTLLLNAHTDTVGVTGMATPHEPRVDGDRLYGRGAYDMKGGLAAAMLAGAAAARAGFAGDVVVAAVADEEVGSLGTEALVRTTRADAAVVTEPTDLAVAVAHRGFVGFEIETTGVAAHGSRPDLGVDAIAKLGPVLVELAALDRRLQACPPHPLLATGSLHASLVEGGQEFSSYPARCVLTGERRTLPCETVADVEQELHNLLARAGSDGELRLLVSRGGYEVEQDEEIVRLVAERSGGAIVGMPFWTDAALLAAAGIPAVLFGPSGGGAHAPVEWVDLPSVAAVRDTLVDVAQAFCECPPDPSLDCTQ